MYDFAYHRPGSVQDATAAMGAAEDGKYLAGGQTLVPTLKMRLAMPSDVIDLAKVDGLQGITADGNRLRIGAGTTHADVAASAEVKGMIPALAGLANNIGDAQVRHMGTLGGSIANNDPAADYPGAVVALGATVHTDRRTIEGEAFFTGMFETALELDELITAVTFPVPEKAAYIKLPNPASRYAMVGVFVAKTAAGVRVAVTGAGACVFRQTAMEEALSKSFTPEALNGIAQSPDGLNEDMHASAAYRAAQVSVLAKRAVAEALA